MSKPPKISEAEWAVMKFLWERSPVTTNEIVEILSQRTKWQRETIRTLINRVVQKKAVQFEKRGRQYHYYPVVAEAKPGSPLGFDVYDPTLTDLRDEYSCFLATSARIHVALNNDLAITHRADRIDFTRALRKIEQEVYSSNVRKTLGML